MLAYFANRSLRDHFYDCSECVWKLLTVFDNMVRESFDLDDDLFSL